MKRIIKELLAISGVLSMSIRRKMNRGEKVVLNYHHIVPDELVEANLFYGYTHSLSHFKEQISFLDREFGFSTDLKDTSRITLTFDDGGLSNFTNVLPVLHELDIQALFFVSDLPPAKTFWFEEWYAWFTYAPAKKYSFQQLEID
ncbi:MAG: polysaccharide deacetylase family protein, partial [Cyclobacteriaceae bacterium]